MSLVDPVTNPYAPGAGTTPPELVGRDSTIEAFRVALRRAAAGQSGKSLMPTGLRGVGKTVLLVEFLRIANEEGCAAASVEASDGRSILPSLMPALRKIVVDFNTGEAVKEIARKALRVLKSISVTLPHGIELRINAEPEPGVADSGNLERDLTDLLLAVGEAAAEEGAVVLIAIDEAQYLVADELVAILVALHKTNQRPLPIIVVATGLPQLLAIAGDAKSYAERLFDFPQLGALTASETAEAIQGPAQRQGVTFTPEALEAIYDVTKGYPYFVQLWAQLAWDLADHSPITVSDVTAVRLRALETLDRGFFSVRFERLTPDERRYLRAMAELETGPYDPEAVAQFLHVSADEASELKSALIEKGMIYSLQDGAVDYTVPLFGSFMKRRME